VLLSVVLDGKKRQVRKEKAFDLQAPGWLVAVIAVGAVAIGIAAITVRTKSLTSS
jgi:hypothetical protein